MAGIREDAYWANESDHALACALYGDCVYDTVKEGALELEKTWEGQARPFGKLLRMAAKTGVFGLGPELDTKWLKKVLFGPLSAWPSGLTQKEKKALLLARSTAGWLTNAELGDTVDPLRGFDAEFKKESEEATGDALKKFSDLYVKNIANPMWDTYDLVSKKYGRKLVPMCEEKYQEQCSESEGVQMFRGDLARGWKVRTLPFSATSYHVFANFLDWSTS